MITSLSVVVFFALLIMFQQRFFVGFFAAYIVVTLVLNLAWKAGWQGVDPPQDAPAGTEIVH